MSQGLPNLSPRDIRVQKLARVFDGRVPEVALRPDTSRALETLWLLSQCVVVEVSDAVAVVEDAKPLYSRSTLWSTCGGLWIWTTHHLDRQNRTPYRQLDHHAVEIDHHTVKLVSMWNSNDVEIDHWIRRRLTNDDGEAHRCFKARVRSDVRRVHDLHTHVAGVVAAKSWRRSF